MKRTIKILEIIFIIAAISLILFGCNKPKSVYTFSGTTLDRVNERFPQIEGIESCKWNCDKASKDSRLSVGPDSYEFYGEIVLTNDYYNKITSDYEWKEYKDETSIDFLDNISSTKKVYISDEYINDVSNTNYLKLLLDEENKTLYFYLLY